MISIKKIAITGRAGSGKTTLTDAIGREFDIPVYYMDRLFFDPKWKLKPDDETFGELARICDGDEWVIDSMGPDTAADNLKKADLLIFIETNIWRCLLNIYYRRIKSIFIPRHETPDGSSNRLYPSFLFNFIFRGKEKNAPWAGLLEEHKDILDYIFIKKANRKTIPALISTLKSKYPA